MSTSQAACPSCVVERIYTCPDCNPKGAQIRIEEAEARVAELEGQIGNAEGDIADTRRIKSRVTELEHIEDTVLACQEMSDAGAAPVEIVNRILSIYVGAVMKRRLASSSVSNQDEPEAQPAAASGSAVPRGGAGSGSGEAGGGAGLSSTECPLCDGTGRLDTSGPPPDPPSDDGGWNDATRMMSNIAGERERRAIEVPTCERCGRLKSAHATIRTSTSSYLRCPPDAVRKVGCGACLVAAEDPMGLYMCHEHESQYRAPRLNKAKIAESKETFLSLDGNRHPKSCGVWGTCTCGVQGGRTQEAMADDELFGLQRVADVARLVVERPDDQKLKRRLVQALNALPEREQRPTDATIKTSGPEPSDGRSASLDSSTPARAPEDAGTLTWMCPHGCPRPRSEHEFYGGVPTGSEHVACPLQRPDHPMPKGDGR